MTWAIDLDGVVWRGDQAIPGSAEAVAALREAGERVVFFTNNSHQPVDAYVAKLERMGVPAAAEDVLTSAQAAASLLEPGSSAVVCAGPGVEEALRERDVRVVDKGPADAVVVGWHPDFDYERLSVATSAVRAGARLIGTNDDATYPTPDGEMPGGGSLLAAVAYASSATPEVAGKPHPAMVALVAERVGEVAVMVGDRPTTDGALAHNLGARFALVLSGVTTRAEAPDDGSCELVADDLGAVVAAWNGADDPEG